MNPLESLLLPLWNDLHDLRVLWQVAGVVTSVVLAWWIAHLVRPLADGPLAPAPK